MKKLFFLLGCLQVLGCASVLAQGAPQVAVVRVVESIWKVRITIARGSAEPEYIEFDGGLISNDAPQVAVGYQRVMAKLYAEGYQLQGPVSGFAGETSGSRSLLFVKVPKP